MNEDNVQRQIDLLVGGDLSKSDARALIATFDDSPERWKSCALAFLEAQSWQRAFAGLGGESSETASASAVAANGPRSLSRTLRFVATIVVSLIVGVAGTAWWFHANPPANDQPVANVDEKPASPVNGDENRKADANWLAVVRVLSDGRAETEYQLVSHNDRDVVLMLSEPQHPSEYDMQLWERRGYRIEQHRKVVSVALANGSRFQIPVDWRQYRYVGEPVF